MRADTCMWGCSFAGHTELAEFPCYFQWEEVINVILHPVRGWSFIHQEIGRFSKQQTADDHGRGVFGVKRLSASAGLWWAPSPRCNQGQGKQPRSGLSMFLFFAKTEEKSEGTNSQFSKRQSVTHTCLSGQVLHVFCIQKSFPFE